MMTDETEHARDTDEHNGGPDGPDGTNGEEEARTTYPDTDTLGTGRFLSTGIRLILVSFVLVCVLYLLGSTGIGQLFWSHEAQGSLVESNGQIVGSTLIGQSFRSNQYFHPRPSSKDYDGMNSGSANLSPENEQLRKRAKELLEQLRAKGIRPDKVPVSFITESGSALDPHIVPASAYLQVPRVSEATGLAQDRLRNIINKLTQSKFLGMYGMERVNVLKLNMKIRTIPEAD